MITKSSLFPIPLFVSGDTIIDNAMSRKKKWDKHMNLFPGLFLYHFGVKLEDLNFMFFVDFSEQYCIFTTNGNNNNIIVCK